MEKDGRKIMISMRNVEKEYRLGQFGHGSLRRDLQSWWAVRHGREDPNTKIGHGKRLSGDRFLALRGIDLDIYKGECLGIIGGNGAGKSTLLKLISRVTAPTKGTIDLYGRVTSMLEVGTGFHSEMTGRENIYLNGAILGMSRAQIDGILDRIIDFSEIREFIDTPVKRYSSGMYVKLGFSVASHLDSEIVIMDEVLAVGDIAFQKKCIDKMLSSAKDDGRTVLYVSHNMNTVRQLCSRCIVLDAGQIVFDGETEEAIEFYSSYLLGRNRAEKDLLEEPRRAGNLTGDVKAAGISCESFTVPAGGGLAFSIVLNASRDIDDVSVRMIVYGRDGSAVGMSYSDPAPIRRGENVWNCRFDTSPLAAGVYNCRIMLVSFSGQIEVKHDSVENALAFSVEDSGRYFGWKWSARSWGEVRLNRIAVERAEASADIREISDDNE